MNLKCKINGKEYNVVQGATFAEEYNETLDSGTIIIAHVKKIKDLMPFDDVFIYDSKSEFNGYGPGIEMPKFYKHLLVDQFSEEIINLDEGIYTYKIELMSETKKLEVIQLPNVSITQPLNIKKKKNIYEYLLNFVELYSPLKKVTVDGEKWTFKKKYSVDPGLETEFGNIYAPDFSLNSPSLKDVISQLMLVKDRIPYVKDDVICALDISARNGPFDLNTDYVNYISGSRSSSNHADNLKRTYSNALSQDNTCNMVEYIGFRNSNSALLTLENMRLETRYPIYKINKVYMCYYKKIKIIDTETNYDVKRNHMFLCKQDITKLVKLNSERNLLKQDWEEFNKLKDSLNIDELSKYKMMTIGYDIGTNFIEGWGTKYTYPDTIPFTNNNLLVWDRNVSYIQNIFEKMNEMYPLGEYSNQFTNEFLKLDDEEAIIQTPKSSAIDIVSKDVVNPNVEIGKIWDIDKINGPGFMKTLFFIIDYNAFYNGTVIHSKDDRFRDDITINDNSSASLTLLEKDGLFQKEKANRFGNKGIAINARYTDISQLQKLGSVYENEDDTDVVIYHREYSIYDNVINCSYAGTKNYVLKNYFTSVFARYRTYNLMSYGESTVRAENNKMMILLSKNKSYYEKENKKINFYKFKNEEPIEQIFSFFVPTEKTNIKNYLKNRGQINMGVIGSNNNWYLSDVNKFISGNSLCFNIKMFDNVSGGVYIKTLQPEYNFDPTDDFVGSVQDWYIIVDDIETGQIKEADFFVFSMDDTYQYANELIPRNSFDLRGEDYLKEKILKEKILKLPFIDTKSDLNFSNYIKNRIGGKYLINKDNKETIDMTFQLEPICYEKDVVFSPWMMKLSDLLFNYNKYDEKEESLIEIDEKLSMDIISTGINVTANSRVSVPMIILSLDKNKFEKYKKMIGYFINKNVIFYSIPATELEQGFVNRYELFLKEIKEINDDWFSVDVDETDNYYDINSSAKFSYLQKYKNIKFKRIYSNEFLKVPDDKIYFSNIELLGYKMDGSKVCWEFDWTYKLNRLLISDFYKYYIHNGYDYKAALSPDKPMLDETNAKFENIIPHIVDNTLDYNKNMYIVYSNEQIKKDIIYEEYELGSLPVSEDKVSEIFSIAKDEMDREYLRIDLKNAKQTGSIQYWYLNGGSLHFVFGANINENDLEKGYIKIYLSLLSTRDTRVYDENNNLVGEIYNYADENSDKNYGEEQYYCDIIENDSGGK